MGHLHSIVGYSAERVENWKPSNTFDLPMNERNMQDLPTFRINWSGAIGMDTFSGASLIKSLRRLMMHGVSRPTQGGWKESVSWFTITKRIEDGRKWKLLRGGLKLTMERSEEKRKLRSHDRI
jgi:hypothetical protein